MSVSILLFEMSSSIRFSSSETSTAVSFELDKFKFCNILLPTFNDCKSGSSEQLSSINDVASDKSNDLKLNIAKFLKANIFLT